MKVVAQGNASLTILFPSESFRPRHVDPDFECEYSAARSAGIRVALVDLDTGAPVVTGITQGLCIYRGWMLRPERYQALYNAASARGATLINDPVSYRTCHHLPEAYPLIEGLTPHSVWVTDVSPNVILEAIQPFGDAPLIVKDYVKSQKHYWHEACFIPAASDSAAVMRVVNRFLELVGDDLNEGLVFREYVPLKIVGQHTKSGLPLAAEFRTFWLDGELLLTHRYWGDLTAFDAPLPLDTLRPIAERIPSRFYSIDVALQEDGNWIIIEVGDGQVTGLPTPELATQFYQEIASRSPK